MFFYIFSKNEDKNMNIKEESSNILQKQDKSLHENDKSYIWFTFLNSTMLCAKIFTELCIV